MWDFSSLLVCDRGAHIVSSIIHRYSTSTVRWPHMHLLQQARLMQSKIPRPLKYKVTSIGDKIQRRGIAPTNNKNNKDISIFFVTQHQLSTIVKHEQKKALLRNGKIHIIYKNAHFFNTMDPKRIIKMSLKVLYCGWGRHAIPWHLQACCDRKPPWETNFT